MWELGVLEWFESMHGSVLDPVMVGISYSATSGLIWFVLGFLMTCSERWRRCGVSVIVSVALAYLVVDVILKPLVCRDRPFEAEDFDMLVAAPESWSFPSGHTASAFAGAAAILIHSRRWGAAAMVYAALVGVSRMYLCVHWPTDVLAGALVGVAVAFAAVWFMSRLIPYFRDLDRDGALVRRRPTRSERIPFPDDPAGPSNPRPPAVVGPALIATPSPGQTAEPSGQGIAASGG